jgi:transcriptional regulator with XRE-family HTH domain
VITATLSQSIGDRLHRLRTDAGLTQIEVGRRIGYSQPAISQWETADRDVLMNAVRLLASLYGVEPGWLAEGAPEDAEAAESDARGGTTT